MEATVQAEIRTENHPNKSLAQPVRHSIGVVQLNILVRPRGTQGKTRKVSNIATCSVQNLKILKIYCSCDSVM
jgi:hypothetical protein